MRKLAYFTDKIDGEICDAKEYLFKAEMLKAEYPNAAQKLFEIAQQELNHAMILHDSIEEIVEDEKKKDKEIPDIMKALWEAKHEEFVEDYNETKAL